MAKKLTIENGHIILKEYIPQSSYFIENHYSLQKSLITIFQKLIPEKVDKLKKEMCLYCGTKLKSANQIYCENCGIYIN